MYFGFKENVFLVNGAKHGCIYDLPSNLLYQINKRSYETLLKVTKNIAVFDTDEVTFLEQLCLKGILVKSELPLPYYKSLEDVFNYPRPFDFAWIEITNVCNLKCIHCYNDNECIPKYTMTLDDFKMAVDQLNQLGIRRIQIIGGEPFTMNKEILFSMLDYISTRVDFFELFINGTLNSDEDLHEIIARYKNVGFATSLHSYIEDEHERVTQTKGSFRKTLKTLKYLKKENVPCRFVGALIGGIFIGEDKELGQPSRRDFIRLAGRGNLHLYNDALLQQRIITAKSMFTGNLYDRVKRIYEENCFSTHLYIGSDLNVYPCPMEKRIHHGNLKEAPLKTLLKNEILSISKKDVEVCKDCEYRFICSDCRPDSITGNIKGKPWYCTYHPYTGEWENFDDFKKRIYGM